ncbi:MAG: aminopeptidase P family N-terminal domain-containing protein, partial [Moraxellaceae bacterium]|nr:aminopeptidase P family N-terminal domain-containing protein [Moraxellaceae bacterium]
MKTINNRLANLRNELHKQQLDAIIIPTADPHLSEYLPSHWQLREWLSGFTGSAGTLVVTTNRLGEYAYLWADSRYWVQAENELTDTEIQLQKLSANNTYRKWLKNNVTDTDKIKIAIDSNMLSVASLTNLQDAFTDKNIEIVTDNNIRQIWQALYQTENSERPSLPTAKLFRHNPQFVSISASEKLAQVRQGMAEHGASHHLLSSLDDIAWLTNLRGADVDYNPVFLSHLLISQQQAILFIDKNKVSDEIAEELKNATIEIADYNDLAKEIAKLTASDSLLIDPNKVAVSSLLTLDKQVKLIKKIAPSTLLK